MVSCLRYSILLTESSSNTSALVRVGKKKTGITYNSHSLFHRKMGILLPVLCCLPVRPPSLPLNLTYILIVLLIQSLGTCPTQASNIPGTKPYVHIMLLSRLTKDSAQVQGSCKAFRNMLNFCSVELSAPNWSTTSYRLYVSVHSMYSQLRAIPSTHKKGMRHAVVTSDPLNMEVLNKGICNPSWLQTQRYRVRFTVLPDFLSSSGSGTGCTQPL
jgi:hypothetical protein